MTRFPRECYSEVYYKLSLYSATLRSKSKRKKEKNRQEKRYCERSVSRCEADCSLRWNCSTETLRNNRWLLMFFFSFFCSVLSGGRTPLVDFDNFIRHGWPYVRTIRLPVARTVLSRFIIDPHTQQYSPSKVCRQYGRHVHAGRAGTNFLRGPRTTARTCRNRS